MDTKLDLFTQSLLTSRDSAVFDCVCTQVYEYIHIHVYVSEHACVSVPYGGQRSTPGIFFFQSLSFFETVSPTEPRAHCFS